MIAIKYGGAMVALPVCKSHRQEVRHTYRMWRQTHDRFDARQYAERTALWFTATSHPRVTVRAKW